MSSHRFLRAGALAAVVASVGLVLTGCGSTSSISGDSGPASAGTIVVGSQSYPSNEVIAEIYAQALEGAGFTVSRKFNVGQRDAYIPALENGTITLFPEYSGNLLQYFDKNTTARSTDAVYDALKKVLPSNLQALNQSSATDQDSYTVTKAFADKYSLSSISDLSKVTVPLTLGGPPELAQRPYGPSGLESVYGIKVAFSATGATTVQDLLAGTVNVANVYTSDPHIKTDNLVVLSDPKSLFLASHIVPIASKSLPEAAAAIINQISAALTPDGLVELNVENTVDQKSAATIAKAWLAAQGIK